MALTPDRPTGAFPSATGSGKRFVSAFAPSPAPRTASQQAKAEAKPIRTEIEAPPGPGRSLPTHPIILRDSPPDAEARPSQAQLNRLHRSLHQRDLVLLQVLHDYRYLNTLQIRELFFPSLRSCQMRLQTLKQLGVIYCWQVVETPGVRRRHSLCLISARGARVLADWRGEDSRDCIERSHHARDHSWHVLHDLEANQFFVSLASCSRDRPDEGLLVWYGEDQSRATYRQRAREYRWPAPAPDGGGIYLVAGGAREVEFDLEWDRATESMARIQQKIETHAGYWQHFRDADRQHVLFVTTTDLRELRLHQAIWRERPRSSYLECCNFWTTTFPRLRAYGPASAIWLRADLKAETTPRRESTQLRLRTALGRMRTANYLRPPVEDCIGKPGWWLRRPGGGQVT